MYYRSNNIMVYLSPDEDGKLLLQQSLFFQQTLGMRVFIYSINDKSPFFKRILRYEKTRHVDSFILQKFIQNVIPAKSLEHFSYRIKTGKRLPLLISQSNSGGYEFMIVDKSDSESALKPGEIDKLISHSYCPIMAVHKNYFLKEVKKIVIPVDVTQSIKKKLLWATYFAKKYKAKIVIVSALALNLDLKKSLGYMNSEKIKNMLAQRGVESDVRILNAHGQKKQLF